MPPRTEAEWRELARQLRRITDDPKESPERQQRALSILQSVPREYRHTPQPPATVTEWDIDFGGIV